MALFPTPVKILLFVSKLILFMALILILPAFPIPNVLLLNALLFVVKFTVLISIFPAFPMALFPTLVLAILILPLLFIT